MSELEINNDLNKNEFLNSTMGKMINKAVDLAIRTALPDLIDDQVINIKDAILVGGFQEGVKELINSGNNLKESVKGIITGEFSSLEQMKLAVKDGGILDFVSFCVDKGINYISKKSGIDNSVLKIITTTKNSIINQVSKDIENKYTSQIENIEKMDKYSKEWKEAFDNKDIEAMEKSNKKIINQRKNIINIENIIGKANTIKNITEIVSNSKDFKLSNEELELANKIY